MIIKNTKHKWEKHTLRYKIVYTSILLLLVASTLATYPLLLKKENNSEITIETMCSETFVTLVAILLVFHNYYDINYFIGFCVACVLTIFRIFIMIYLYYNYFK